MNGPTRILILEDTPTDIDLAQGEIVKSLKSCVFQIAETRQGLLNALASFEPDLIIADDSLPHLDVMTALQLAFEHASCTPVIVLAGSMNEDRVVACIKIGAANYVLKDNVERLGPVVLHALKEKQVLIERKLPEEALRESEARYRHISSTISDMAYSCTTDPDGNYTISWMMGAAERIVGYSIDEIVAQQCWGFLVTPEDQTLFKRHVTRLHPAESGSCELRLLHKNGDLIWVASYAECVASPISGQHIYGALVDITKRKQAEHALETSLERFQDIANNAQEWIWEVDAEGHYTYASPMVEQILGYSPDEILQKHFYDFFYPADREVLKTAALTTFAAKQPFREFINRNVHKDGRIIWLTTSGLPMLDDQGKLLGYRGIDADVTERKRAEDALRESEHRLAQAQSVAHIGSWELNLATRTMWASVEAFRIYGLEIPLDQLLPLTLVQQIPQPFERSRLDQALKDLIQNNLPYNIEFAINRADNGTVRDIHSVAQLVRDEQGRAMIVAGTIQDVTDRRQAEKTSRQNEELFRAAFENTLVGQVFTSLTGQLLNVNEAFCRMLGYLPQELLQVEFATLTHPDDRELNLHTMQQLLQGKQRTCRFEKRYLHKNGAVVWVDIGVSVVYDGEGKPRHFVTYTQDITERKRTEVALSKSEARYRHHFEHVADVIYSLDCDFRITDVSPSVERTLGYVPSELIGKPFPKLGLLAPESFETAIADTLRILQGERVSAEYVFIAKNGTRLIGEITGTPLCDTNNQIVGVLSVARDITERKKHEREVQAIAAVSAALRTATTRDEMFPVIVTQTAELLTTSGVAISLRDPATDESVVMYGNGTWAYAKGDRVPMGQGLSGRIFVTKEIYLVNDLSTDPLFYSRQWIGHTHGAACLPLIAQDRVIGCLFAGTANTFNAQDIRILTAIADIAANAIHRATLFEEIHKYSTELEHAYETTLEGWANALELRDQETNGHTRRVVQLTIELARALGIRESEMEPIQRGALLHDIGKMGIPDSVLLKPGTLNEREWEIMRQHPEYAYKLLSPIDYLYSAIDIPYCHHEKWDGSCYPRRLIGEAIPLAARIFAVVDVWDALCSNRPYRLAWSKEKARAYLQSESGKHFDPVIVDTFLKMIGSSSNT